MASPAKRKDEQLTIDEYVKMLDNLEKFDSNLRKDAIKCHQCAQECFDIFAVEYGDGKKRTFCHEKCYKKFSQIHSQRKRSLSAEERNK